MISKAMQVITKVLEDALQAERPESPPPVRMGRVSEAEVGNGTGLVLSLVNLGVDSPQPSRAPGGKAALPDLRLTVLIAAGPDNGYDESLDLLSTALRHLHGNPVLTAANHPPMAGTFERLNIQPLSLDLERLRGLWSLQGAPYCPSLAYEIRVQPTAPEKGAGAAT